MTDELELDPLDGNEKYSQALNKGNKTFTVDWFYPAFHMIMENQTKKPPLETPLTIPWPAGVKRNTYFFDPSGCTFKSFKCRVRSRVNHNALMVVWVFAPNQEIALRYIKNELNIRSPV